MSTLVEMIEADFFDQDDLKDWHARAMKLANEMEHYGHVTHYPAMCAKCRLLALLGDLP